MSKDLALLAVIAAGLWLLREQEAAQRTGLPMFSTPLAISQRDPRVYTF